MANARDHISKLARELGEVFKVSDAASLLKMSPIETSKMLSRWTKQGWIMRIRYGLYAVVSIEAISKDQPLENMWILISELFSPGYIGGWSAAEYWDFTEQVFTDICALTEKKLTHKKHEILGIGYVPKQT